MQNAGGFLQTQAVFSTAPTFGTVRAGSLDGEVPSSALRESSSKEQACKNLGVHQTLHPAFLEHYVINSKTVMSCNRAAPLVLINSRTSL